jgi:hypothetical protein
VSELASALLGVLLGGLGAFLIQSYYSVRSQDIAQINDFIADLERFDLLAVEYWLLSQDTSDDERARCAARVRGASHAMTMFYSVGPALLANDWQRFEELDGCLFDAATGGNFETGSHKPEPARVVEIMQYTNEIRSLLRGARRKTFSAR